MEKAQTMKASVIISVYRNVEALRLILDSLSKQTEKDFEVIVSEDGENQDMSKFISQYKWFCPHQHLTQEDEGWRKNRALNRAVLSANSDWLIFIDGDCLLHKRFVEMHLRYAKPNRVLLGKRVKLSYSLSNKLFKGELHVAQLSFCMWLRLIFRQGCRYVDEGIFIPFFKNCQFHSARHLTGCNMSFSRQAIMSINGFDEDYVLPAVGEDADIDWRLRSLGYDFFSVRNRAVQYHLFHKENWIDQSANLLLMKERQNANRIKCINGLNLHKDGN